MSFTTEAFDKAAAAYLESTLGVLWTPAETALDDTLADNPAYAALTYTPPDLGAAITAVTTDMDAELLALETKLGQIYTAMFGALQPQQALLDALAAADTINASADIGLSESLRTEYLAGSYNPLAGMQALGLTPTAPQRASTLSTDTLAAFDAAREKARRERDIALKARKIALSVEIISLTRDLVIAEVEARLKLLSSASLPIQEEKLKADFAVKVSQNQTRQLQAQAWKLTEGTDKKQEALYKAQGSYERIALKSGLSVQTVRSVIASATTSAAGALNSVSFGFSDRTTDSVTYDYNNPP